MRGTSAADGLRITAFLPSLSGGGAERSMVGVVTGLADRGHRVDLLTASADEAPNNRPRPGLRHRSFATRHTRAAIPGLVRHVRAERPDVLLTAMDQANLAGLVARRLTGVPLVVSYHTDVLAAARRSRRLFSYVRPHLARWTIRSADHVVAVSEGVRTGLAQLVPEAHGKITTIYNPTVRRQLFELAARTPDRVPDGVELDRTILAVGRLVPAKGFDVLVDAFAKVARAHPDAQLLVLGEGPLHAELLGRAAAAGVGDRVHFAGYVDNPYQHMAWCRVLASSSFWEGLPTVLVEAGALGCRIVATDCPSGPREILAGRPQATLVGVGDVTGLARALDAALGAPYERWLGDWSEHTLARSVADYEEVLRAVASPRDR